MENVNVLTPDGPVTDLIGITGRQAGTGREAQPGTGTTGAHH